MSTFIRHILTVASGGVASQLLVIVTMPVLTRLYLPAAYAGWALLMSVVIIFTSIATLRYELAIVLPSTHEEAANVMAVCGVVTITIAACAALLLPFLGVWLIGKGFQEELKLWLWCVPPLIAVTGIYQACNSWCTRTQEFAWYALSQVALPFLTILGQISAALAGLRTPSGLILGTLVGQCAAAAFLFLLISVKYGSSMFRSVHWSQMRHSFVRYKAYPLYMTPYTFVGTIRDRLVYFLFANFTSKSVLGYYSLSARLNNMPNSLVSSAMRPVFFQKAATSNFKSLETGITRAVNTLAICVVPFWIVFLFYAKTLFALVFGEPWREAGLYAAILSIPAIPLLMGNWLDRSFDVLGRQRLAFMLELVFSIFTIGVLTVGMLVFEKALMAVSLQAGALALYYSYWLVALFRAAEFDRRGLLKLAYVIFWLSVISSAFTWLLSATLPFSIAIIVNISSVSVCIAVYLRRQWRDLRFNYSG